MSHSPQQPTGRRVGRWILLGLLSLVLLICLVWVALDMSAKYDLMRYEQRWEGKGEDFAFADFIPKPVPDALNFALTPVVASSYEGILDKSGHAIHPQNKNVVNRLDMKIYGKESLLPWPKNSGNWMEGRMTDLEAFQRYYRALAAKTNEFPVAPQPQSPAADVLLALSKYDTTIEELQRAAALPDSRFPLNYDCEPPTYILLPHLAALKQCSQVLELRAVAELQNGQSDKALANVVLTLRLMASVRNEPFLISQLVRIDMLNLALQPVWEGIQEHRWSAAQLKELDEGLAELDFLTDYESSIRDERALMIANFEYLRRTHNVGMFFGGEENVIPLATELELRFAPSCVFYQNELSLARACQEWILPIPDVKRHCVSIQAVRHAATYIEQMRQHWSLNNVLAALALPAYVTVAQRCCHAQSSVGMARVACALERYRLAQGEYPTSLAALAPRFIESVPPDVIGGQPLKYRRTGDGQFVLYSVGWNGTDDGGTIFLQADSKTLIDDNRGDWVWAGRVIDGQ